MISRLTATAACFAVLAALMITFGASATAHRAEAVSAATPVLQLPRVEIVGHRQASVEVIQLPRVEIVGHRTPRAER